MKKLILLTWFVLAVFLTSTALAESSFFQAWSYDNLVGPPYPTSLMEVGVNLKNSAGQFNEIARLKTHMEKAPADMSLRMTSHNGSGGDFAVDSFFDIFYTGTEGSFPVDSFFDVFFDIYAPSSSPGIVRTTPTLNSDYTVDSFFDITYQIEFEDGGSLTMDLRGDPLPGVTLGVVNLGDGNFNVDSFFDVYTELTVDFGVATLGNPLVTMRIRGNYTPEPTTIFLLALGGIVLRIKRRA